jgi:hypothetical protein
MESTTSHTPWALLGALLLLGAAAQPSHAAGIETRQFAFKVTYSLNSAKNRHQHIYTGRCEVQMLGSSPYGLAGPTGGQRQSDTQAREKAVAPGRGMAEELQKCGSDMACATAVMQAAQASGDLARMGRGVQQVARQEANFNNWTASPKPCSELTLTVDDKFEQRVSDSGEGGDRVYLIQTAIKGSKSITALFGSDANFGIQHDLRTKQSEYRFGRPRFPGFPTTRQGNAPPDLVGSRDTPVDPYPLTIPFPVQAGAPRSGKSVANAPNGGTVNFEWTLQ